jgi:hypothetical protein
MSEPTAAPDEATRPTRSRAATRQTWADRIGRFPQSGLSPAQFCAAEGVSLAAFYAWKRRFAAEADDGGNHAPDDAGPRLLPVRLQSATPVELVLPGGAVLRLLPGCDLDLVRALLRALGEAPC